MPYKYPRLATVALYPQVRWYLRTFKVPALDLSSSAGTPGWSKSQTRRYQKYHPSFLESRQVDREWPVELIPMGRPSRARVYLKLIPISLGHDFIPHFLRMSNVFCNRRWSPTLGYRKLLGLCFYLPNLFDTFYASPLKVLRNRFMMKVAFMKHSRRHRKTQTTTLNGVEAKFPAVPCKSKRG